MSHNPTLLEALAEAAMNASTTRDADTIHNAIDALTDENGARVERIPTPEALARRFHDLYEAMAPLHGYETRQDTREFDPMSKNGKLMVAVCDSIIRQGLIREAASNERIP